jgi:hypothetical protein
MAAGRWVINGSPIWATASPGWIASGVMATTEVAHIIDGRAETRSPSVQLWAAGEGVRMTLGPLEYTVIGFEGNRFNREIARELHEVVAKGGRPHRRPGFHHQGHRPRRDGGELDVKDDPRFAGFAPMLVGLEGLLTPEDVVEIGAMLPNNTSALTVLFEHRLAVHLKESIAAAGGFLVSRTTIAPAILEELNAELDLFAA